LPVLVGVKVTETVQLSPTFNDVGSVPQIGVWAKSPVMSIFERVREVWPVLVILTTWLGLVSPTIWEGKLSFVGVMVTAPADVTIPVPVTVMRWGLPSALSSMEIWSVLKPVVVGVNVIWREQLPPPAGRVVPQLFVWAKSPPAVIPVMLKGALPALMSVTERGSLALKRVWFPKLISCGFTAIPGRSEASILATKALLEVPRPAYAPCRATPTVGKFVEFVLPTTRGWPEESTAIAWPDSAPLPPRNVEYTAWPEGLSSTTKASEQMSVPHVLAPNRPRTLWSGSTVGKSLDRVEPVTKTSPFESSVIAVPWSASLPPNKVE
jgi:hypothetical protein